MKTGTRFLTVALILTMLFSAFALTAYAKELEPCRLCGGKGDYHCVSCGNTGTVTCRGCGGSGRWECPGEDGKGKCNDGYYVCPSCNGDGKNRSGDGKIIDGNCGQCGGNGKLVCWTCHGTPKRACDGCNGTGKEECQVGTCKVSRAYGWKCPDCKGTGFILVGNPMPPKANNDGVRNVPSNGDYIVTNDKTWAGYTYGGGNGNTSTGKGTGTGTGTSSEPVQQSDPPTDQPENDPPESDVPPADLTLVPENRNTDFDISIPEDPARPIPSSVRVETGRMTDEQQRYFAGLPDEKLAQILTNVRSIVASAEPGRSTPETDELLSTLAAQNGYESVEDGRIFPLYFEGHEEIGFPVRVTVSIDKGVLSGGTDLYVYHIAEDGAIELLGKAEYGTYEDGSVQSVSFYTSSFSTFFTAEKELELPLADPVTENTTQKETASSSIWIVPTVIAAAVMAIAVVLIILLARKRKARKESAI